MWRKSLILLCAFNSMIRSEKAPVQPVPYLGVAPITAALKSSELLQLKNGSASTVQSSNSSADQLAFKSTTMASPKLPEAKNFAPYNSSSSQNPINNPMNFSCNHLNFSLPEPEKCCNFPDLFPDETVDKCEKDFGLNISSVNNELLGDSCVVECIFNRTGLKTSSKLNRDDFLKVFANRTKNDTAWNSLITNAVDVCLTDLSHEAINDFLLTVSNETSSVPTKAPSKNQLCHPLSAFTLDCIFMELFKVCPQQKFNQTMKGCSELKTHTMNCDDW